MKKTRYFPFERNRYFYGKLLTVRDFESEQRYVNDKRRLLNRLLFGSGIVAGMQVVAVDDKSISVEMGVAIDYAGREVVIPSPVTLKLSMIEGFTNNEYKKNVYLCAAYDEKGKEPVHSVANSNIRSEEVSEYNRILESYRLFIKEEAPDPLSFEHVRLSESVSILYQDRDVRIYQRMPKYVNPEEIVEVTLVVEKTLQTPRISLEYEFESSGFTPIGGSGQPVVRFADPGDGQDTEYTLTYRLKADNEPGKTATLNIRQESIKLTIGDLRAAVQSHPEHKVDIVQGPVSDRILKDYYERSLDQAVDDAGDAAIYLAKISLLQIGPTYMIEKIDRVPFGEYVHNASVLQRTGAGGAGSGERSNLFFTKSQAYGLEHDQTPKLDVTYNPERHEFDFKLGIPKPKRLNEEMATGTVVIPLESNAKTGMNFFSRGKKNYVTDEISHGLGSGSTYIEIGLEDTEEGILSAKDHVYYGSMDVFKGSEFEAAIPNVSFGTIVYPNSGTFQIGIKLHQATQAETIRLRWWAFKKMDGQSGNTEQEVRPGGFAFSGEEGAAEAAAGKEQK